LSSAARPIGEASAEPVEDRPAEPEADMENDRLLHHRQGEAAAEKPASSFSFAGSCPRIVFPFNVIRMPPAAGAADVEQMIAANRSLYERIRAAGGFCYPVGAVPMSSEDWRDHFGSRWPLFEVAKRRYDPDNRLTPGYPVF
jgi:FAD/FMN-containing dehydrogenase